MSIAPLSINLSYEVSIPKGAIMSKRLALRVRHHLVSIPKGAIMRQSAVYGEETIRSFNSKRCDYELCGV